MTAGLAQELEAGRELDALIAERLMGWRWFRLQRMRHSCCAKPQPIGEPVRFLANDKPFSLYDDYNPATGDERVDESRMTAVPHYSTDISAAMEVVEKLKADDFWPSMNWKSGIFIDDWNRAAWFVRFRCVRGGTRGDHWHADESLPLAICRAALRALSEG
jgi:hypothetical protein